MQKNVIHINIENAGNGYTYNGTPIIKGFTRLNKYGRERIILRLATGVGCGFREIAVGWTRDADGVELRGIINVDAK